MVLSKWSEKVGALDTILECGGEKPYKLVEQSSSVNYAPLISEMKKLLSHTHFAVVSKAMCVLAMLGEGVGEKLYPFLRPLLSTLIQLSKDKKLTRPTASCLDSLFGKVLAFEHLLDLEDSIPFALDEKRQKNALARTSALEYLGRCVERRDSAGTRGSLSPHTASDVTRLCVLKLDDSDASVRKAAMDVLEKLLKVEDEKVNTSVIEIVETLKYTNSRAYKSLSNNGSVENASLPKQAPTIADISKGGSNANKSANAEKGVTPSTHPTQTITKSSNDLTNTTLTDAIARVESLCIPLWDAPEDDGGILSGLQGKTQQQIISAF